MKDRLAELKALAGLTVKENYSFVEEHFDNEPCLLDFLTEVQQIRRNIDEIAKNVKRIKKIHSDILSAPRQDKRTHQELEKITTKIKKSATKVRIELRQIDTSIKNMSHPREVASRTMLRIKQASRTMLRIKQTQCMVLYRLFNENMAAYQKSQSDYDQAYKERIQRQLELTGKQVSGDELKYIMQNATDIDEAIFWGDIVTDVQDAMEVLKNTQERHESIAKLEKHIQELFDIFTDMAMMVEQQWDLLDRIEYNVTSTEEQVDVAKKNLAKAARR